MAPILRTALFRPKYFGKNATGLFESVLGCQTSNSIRRSLPFSSSASSLIGSEAGRKDRVYSKDKLYRNMPIQTAKFFRPNKFEMINFEPVFAANVHENTLVTVFMKMCNTYKSFQNQFKLSKSLKYFLHSPEFKGFCSTLNKKLPEFSTSCLLPLLEFYYFQTRESEILFEKILKMILENINEFTVLEKLHLYNRLQREGFNSNKTCQEIVKVLDTYLDVCFVNDLYRIRDNKDLLGLLSLDRLSSYVKKQIVTRLVDESHNFTLAGSQHNLSVILKLCEGSYKLAKRDKVVDIIKKYLYLSVSSMTCLAVLKSYSRVVREDPSYFDEGIIEIVIDFYSSKAHNPSHRVRAFSYLCSVGYWDERMVRMVYDFIVSEYTYRNKSVIRAAEFLFRCSVESLTADEQRNVLRVMSNLHLGDLSFEEKCLYCTVLMGFGQHPKDVLNEVFAMVQQGIWDVKPDCNPLQLHHQAKALGLEGYEPPSEDLLQTMLRSEFDKLFSTDLDLRDFLQSDHVLKGCTTSDHHCLHFVAAFAPDGSAVDLSPYVEPPPFRPDIGSIKLPPEAEMFVFQLYPDDQLPEFRNVPKQSGTYQLFMKSFQGLDCNIVLLTPQFLKSNTQGRRKFLENEVGKVLWKTE